MNDKNASHQQEQLDDREVRRRLEFLNFSGDDSRRIKDASGALQGVSAQVADQFYDHLQKFRELSDLLRGRVDALKQTQGKYFQDLLRGSVDGQYVESRVRVGQVHERIGLAPKWYMGAFYLYMSLSSQALRRDPATGKDPVKAWDTLMSLTKLIFFDMSVAIDAYINRLLDTVQEQQRKLIDAQQELLRELSAPIIEVWEEVLVVPLVGTMDTRRAQDITEKLLSAVIEKRSRVAIIDITGLPVMDTSTANHLIKTVRAVELLGAQAYITGIRPAIAQTVVSLGVDTSTLHTKARLADGLKSAMEHLAERRQKAANGDGRTAEQSLRQSAAKAG